MKRVKKARIQAKKDRLQLEFLEAKKHLDQAVLALAEQEEFMDKCPLRLLAGKLQNLKRLKDKTEAALEKVCIAEEAILDYQDNE